MTYPIILMGFVFIFTNGCKKDTTSTQSGTLKDLDGNVYHPVSIGSQVWMAENLKTTQLNDGTPILNATGNTAWVYASSPAYCWFNDSVTYKTSYGALYNWTAASNSKLCPSGWHVPDDAEWTALSNSLGGNNFSGGKLKETGSTHWASPNIVADSSSGFAALPGGYRTNGGDFMESASLVYGGVQPRS